MTIKDQLLETYGKKVLELSKKKSRFSYGISLFSSNPPINENLFGEGITFQPTGMNNIDVPLLFDKAEKVFEETIEYLFEISIQERLLREDGNFEGLYLLDKEGAKGGIIIELKGLSEDSSRDNYIIELPENNFDYGATKSIYKRSYVPMPPYEPYEVNDLIYSESYNFGEHFSEIEDLYTDFSGEEDINNKPRPEPFSVIKEFEINEYLTLKLLNHKILGRYTRIFLNNNPFLQCAYILITNPQEHKFQSEINSIDEASEKLDSKMELLIKTTSFASPETLFWAHCSNIQAWYELGYDTRILHSNLAFPLLKKLFQAGDVKAKRVFKEQIAKRLLDQYPPVIIYLLNEKYLEYLNKSEIEVVFYELNNQINLPNSRLLNQELANTLLNVGKKYIEKGSDYGSLFVNLSIKIKELILNPF